MNGISLHCDKPTSMSALRILEYVPTTWIADYGFPNSSLKWLNGITLKPGRFWLRADRTTPNRLFTSDLGKTSSGRPWSRRVEFTVNQDSSALQLEWEKMKQYRFVLRGITMAGEGQLLCTPQYPAEFSVSQDREKPIIHQRGIFSIQSPQPIYYYDFGGSVNNGIENIKQRIPVTQAQFNQLYNTSTLQEGIYIITDLTPQQAWLSGGGNTAINITFGPLRYIKDEISGAYMYLSGITASTAEERLRMHFYRGGSRIFINEDFSILANDVIQFFLPFENETFHAFY